MSKSLDELALSTAIGKYKENKYPWTRLFSGNIQTLSGPHISDRVRSLYLLLQPILHEGDGFLLDRFGKAHTTESLSECLYNRKHVKTDLEKLVRLGVLMEQDGVLFCLMTLAAKRQNQGGTLGVLVNNAKYNDFQVTASLEKAENNRERVDKSRLSQSATADLTKYCPSESQTETETDKNRLLPSPIFGLTETDLEEVRDKFPNLDFDTVYQKFVGYHKNKGTEKVTKAQFLGWFKREKPTKEKAPASSTTPKPTNNSETLFMRDMPRFYPLTEEQKADEAAGEAIYEAPGLYAALNWFCALRGVDSEDDKAQDLFERAVEDAIKAGNVVVAESMTGVCNVGANRAPVMILKKVGNYLKGQNPDNPKHKPVSYRDEISIDEHVIRYAELDKIRAMTSLPEDQAVRFLKKLLPNVETNWLAVLDEHWLFDNTEGLYSGKPDEPQPAPPSQPQKDQGGDVPLEPQFGEPDVPHELTSIDEAEAFAKANSGEWNDDKFGEWIRAQTPFTGHDTDQAACGF